MHPWTRAYRDIYSAEDIDTMKYTWESPPKIIDKLTELECLEPTNKEE